MRNINPILRVDSYKSSMTKQYPPGMTGYYGYIESRGSDRHWDHTLFFGLQAFIKEYLLTPITTEQVEEAASFFALHGEPFDKDMWMKVVTKHNGFIPCRIRAIEEGTIVPTRVPLVTIESTDPEFAKGCTHLETALLRAIWYPTTVATNSYYCRQVIKEYMEKTCDNLDGLNFKLHDFGARGVSSSESAVLGGMAHLATGFMGSDTVEGILGAKMYYDEDMAAYSIPAAEHSTITSWGKDGEVEAYRNMIRQFSGEGKIYAVVSDSYDIFNACKKIWGEVLKDEVINSKGLLVIRPDSGQPDVVVRQCVEILADQFGYTKNSKGFKVLNHVRVIQGDGIEENSIRNILGALMAYGFSAENVAFGMGGKLLQGLDRDTMKFALKCSAVKLNGEWVDVVKDPITDPGKKSKAGRVTAVNEGGVIRAGKINEGWIDRAVDCMKTVYEDGKLLNEVVFSTVRANANK